MRRRQLLFALAGAPALEMSASEGRAQRSLLPARIGVLREAPPTGQYRAFVDRLHELGRIEGSNITIEYRRANTAADLERAARALVELQVSVIFAPTPLCALAANRAQATVPIVFAVVGDPVKSGLAASLSRPGGNATGLTAFGSDLGGKRLDLLRELIPDLHRIGVLWNSAVPDKQIEWRNLQEAAQATNVSLHSIEVTTADQFERGFAELGQVNPEAVIVLPEPLMFSNMSRIIVWAAGARLPSIFAWREAAAAGAPIAYGPSISANYRRAAEYVDRILRGARAADLPIEQPVHVELVVNAGAARALALKLPSMIMARADEVIE